MFILIYYPISLYPRTVTRTICVRDNSVFIIGEGRRVSLEDLRGSDHMVFRRNGGVFICHGAIKRPLILNRVLTCGTEK